MKNKIYIAGPMTGYPDFNKQAFHSMAEHLTKNGHIVLNPAVLPVGLSQSEYMDICLAMVRSSDSVVMLDGWRFSAGALAEYQLARKLGKEILDQKGEPIRNDGHLKLSKNDLQEVIRQSYEIGRKDQKNSMLDTLAVMNTKSRVDLAFKDIMWQMNTNIDFGVKKQDV